jgi:peptidoglycan/xylan/chitin deacetylase (PgdA/CDA1 family)
LNALPIVVAAGATAVAGVTAWGAVAVSSELFGPTVRHTSSAKRIALTFDDGPNPAVTPQLLDLLERHSASATFFLIGRFVRECPELAREISARGHLLGNHTHTHPNLFLQSRAGIRDELARCQDAISEAMGSVPRWMRPPYGYRNPLLNREVRHAEMLGVVMWSKICRDWKPQPPERLIKTLANVGHRRGLNSKDEGDIVLLHDGGSRALGADRHHVVAALEHWLPRWRDAGMEFVTIEPHAVSDATAAVRAPRT